MNCNPPVKRAVGSGTGVPPVNHAQMRVPHSNGTTTVKRMGSGFLIHHLAEARCAGYGAATGNRATHRFKLP
jgi:hypothetical protein